MHDIPAARRHELARTMRALGHLGFWAQMGLATIPAAIGISAFFATHIIAAEIVALVLGLVLLNRVWMLTTARPAAAVPAISGPAG